MSSISKWPITAHGSLCCKVDFSARSFQTKQSGKWVTSMPCLDYAALKTMKHYIIHHNSPYPFLSITSGAIYSGVPNTCMSLNCWQSLSMDPSYMFVVTEVRKDNSIHLNPCNALLIAYVQLYKYTLDGNHILSSIN